MKIAICGSMTFAKEMLNVASRLSKRGHICHLPEETEKYVTGEVKIIGDKIGASRKIEADLINKHYHKIKDSDAVLVLNYDKKGIKNYIGGNSFLEMGFAYVLGKKIFLLNEVPDLGFLREEVLAMKPIIIGNKLSSIS